jgi:PPOX class probable F420-dependent enzyme
VIEVDEQLAHWLQREKMAWLTTVRADGTPLPTPIWFLWTGTCFLIFSQPDALKVKNIRRNPKVAVNFNTDATGEIFAVFTGEAEIDPKPVSPEERAAYVDKYRRGMQMIGVTPEVHAQTWSAVIRFTPSHVRVQMDEPEGSL